MEKYEGAKMEIVEFEAEDIIATSGCTAFNTPCGRDEDIGEWDF